MNELIRQAQDPEQVRGRERQVRVVRSRSGTLGIRYLTPNGRDFFINPNGYPYGDPKVWSKWPKDRGLQTGHTTHYFGNGYICYATDPNRLDLYEILFLIDAWTRAFERYLNGEPFAPNAREAFKRRRR